MPKFAFITFGCKVNQYEGQGLRENLQERGYSEVDAQSPADLYILNTCTVTETASKEATKLAKKLHKKNPSAKITITGCAAETHRKVFMELAGVQSVINHEDKHQLPQLIQTGSNPYPETTIRKRAKIRDENIFEIGISRFDNHTRAFVKVEDGCDLCCSFCIIPKVRGGPTSRALPPIIEEAKRLIGNGYREIVLTGVHLGAYGKDLNGKINISHLVEELLTLPLDRIRLSSLEANEIDDHLIDLMAAEPGRFCPHLHLPLQSGDTQILRAMRRRYNPKQFLEACEKVAKRVPNPSFTTDVIVGFPGETEAQFENSINICRKVGMSRIHIFPYSPRTGTDAALLPETISPIEKKARLHRLKAEAKIMTRKYAEKFIGKEVSVLWEKDGGYTERYLQARLPGKPNELIRARVTSVKNGELICERIP